MIFNQPQDGITPHIGDNGNWFLGKNDTGVRANGQTTTELIPLTILASDWNTETGEVVVSCTGISANEADQIVTLIPSVESKVVCNEAAIECIAIDTNSFTLKADTIPAEDIHIYVAMEVVGKVAGGTDNSVYSLEETVVGTWIDGKPVYRKVLIGAVPTVTTDGTFAWSYYPIEATVDTALPLHGYIRHSSTLEILPLPYTSNSGEGRAKATLDTKNNRIGMGCNCSSWSGFLAVIVAEYTKTTDAATVNLPDAAAMAAAYEQGVNEA